MGIYLLFVLGCLASLVIGFLGGAWTIDAGWRLSGSRPASIRTAHCSGGKFYYVIPESEFMDNYIRRDLPNPEVERLKALIASLTSRLANQSVLLKQSGETPLDGDRSMN